MNIIKYPKSSDYHLNYTIKIKMNEMCTKIATASYSDTLIEHTARLFCCNNLT